MTNKYPLKAGVLAVFAVSLLVTSPHSLAQESAESDLDFYGFFAWRMEKVFDEPSIDANGRTVKEDASREIAIPSFNLMAQYAFNDKFKTFFNLNGEDAEDFTVRNIWGEYSHNQYLNIRVGKMYRRFGLYNELLDAVPTYMGIEPPELFDGDHLIVSRTTLVMVHGWVPLGDGELSYSWTTDNGEGGPQDDNVPMGFDLRYGWNLGANTVGISAYSSNGDTTSDVDLGDGSPESGVLPWMAADDFTVFGGYGEFNIGSATIQAAYWTASHDATRDADAVVTVVNQAGVNDAQRSRFLLDPNGAVDPSNVDTDGDYDVKTWYVRAGYSFLTENGEWAPYIQWDHFDNPETIQSKTFGGDNEAGLADDGKFSKGTIGIVYRPVPTLAIKLDASAHFQEFNGKDESYPELRLDVSYIFGR